MLRHLQVRQDPPRRWPHHGLPLPPDMQMQAVSPKEVADECIAYTKTARLSARAGEVALVAIATYAPELPLEEYRAAIKREYRKRNPECGSVFLLFVLPILANLISHWLIKWFSHKSDSEIRRMTMDAATSLASR